MRRVVIAAATASLACGGGTASTARPEGGALVRDGATGGDGGMGSDNGGMGSDNGGMGAADVLAEQGTEGGQASRGDGAEPDAAGAQDAATADAGACPAVCDGSCIDEQNDSHNCGGCGHDCQGGTCTTGRCQPVVLVDGLSIDLSGIALGPNTVYYLDRGSLFECAKTGCPAGPNVLSATIGVIAADA